MKLEDLQLEIRAYSPSQTIALAARMLQQRPVPMLLAWGFSFALIFGFGVLLLSLPDLHPAFAWALILLGSSLFLLPLITTVGHLTFSPEVHFGVVTRKTLRRVIPFLLLFLFNRFLTLVGLSFLLIPGLYQWRNGWFLGPIVLLEGSSLGASFRRSRRFTLGFNGHVLAHAGNTALVLGYFIVAFASLFHFFITQVLGLTFAKLATLPLQADYYHFLFLGGFALAAPFAMLVWFFVYLDIRTRKEGWDLELAFRARAAQIEQSILHES